MSGLKGNPAKLKGLMRHVKGLGTVAAQRVAAKVAPQLTALARADFNAQTNPYGDPWGPKVDGSRPTLVKSGATRASLGYVATGTILRAALGTRWAKYLLGHGWKLLPSGKPPRDMLAVLETAMREEITSELGKVA